MADDKPAEQFFEFLQKLATEHAELKRALHVEKQMVGLLYSIMLQHHSETAAMLELTALAAGQAAAQNPATKDSAEALTKRAKELSSLKGTAFKPSVH